MELSGGVVLGGADGGFVLTIDGSSCVWLKGATISGFGGELVEQFRQYLPYLPNGYRMVGAGGIEVRDEEDNTVTDPVKLSVVYNVEVVQPSAGGDIATVPSPADGDTPITAAAGSDVLLDVSPDYADGYITKSVFYTPAGEQSAPITSKKGSYSFTMPEKDVTVSASFIQHEHHFTFAAGGDTITATFTPSDSNYKVVEDIDVTVTVSKPEGETPLDDVKISVCKDEAGFEASVAPIVPQDMGAVEGYEPGEATTTGTVTVSDVKVSREGVVSASMSSGSAGDTITVPVWVYGQNYDGKTNVVVTLVDRFTATAWAAPPQLPLRWR